jgi:queuosine precursor transporter
MKFLWRTYALVYLSAIVVANLAIAKFGQSAAIVVPLLFVSLDLTSRDKLHDLWDGKNLWRNMLLLIGTGSVLSWILNAKAGSIALASFVAFASSGIIDAIIYQILPKDKKLLRINGSNILSALVDSTVFLGIAFGWPPALPLVVAQFMAKVLGGLVWSLILYGRLKK